MTELDTHESRVRIVTRMVTALRADETAHVAAAAQHPIAANLNEINSRLSVGQGSTITLTPEPPGSS